MNRDDIIRMAREVHTGVVFMPEELVRFAELVAAASQKQPGWRWVPVDPDDADGMPGAVWVGKRRYVPEDSDTALLMAAVARQQELEIECKELTALLRQAFEAIQTFREWEMGQDYNSNRDTVLAKAFEAEEALIKRLEGEQ